MDNKQDVSHVKIIRSPLLDGIEMKTATFCNKKFPQHFHTEWSLGSINFGIENVGFENTDLQLFPNATILIPAYSVHSHFGSMNIKWSYQSIYLNSDIIKYYIDKFGFDYSLLSLQPYFLSYNRNHIFNASKPAVCQFESILFSLFSNTKIEFKDINSQLFINEVQQFLQLQSGSKITLELLEHRFCIDRFRLIRLFKRQTGLSPQNYLTNLRIEMAKKDLFTADKIVEVALKNGFYDQSHFVHTFKKYTGFTPFDYKASCKILQDYPNS